MFRVAFHQRQWRRVAALAFIVDDRHYMLDSPSTASVWDNRIDVQHTDDIRHLRPLGMELTGKTRNMRGKIDP